MADLGKAKSSPSHDSRVSHRRASQFDERCEPTGRGCRWPDIRWAQHKAFACLPTQADCVSIPPGLSSGRRSGNPARNRPCHRKRKGEGEDGDRRKEVVRSCSTAIRAMAAADGARAIAVDGAIYPCCVIPPEVQANQRSSHGRLDRALWRLAAVSEAHAIGRSNMADSVGLRSAAADPTCRTAWRPGRNSAM
jgi:hypothetical protein